MITRKDFAREVEAIALTVTGYQSGKSGQNGLCDCIGLIMGAMARLGHSAYPMHSTNYFARYQMDNLRELGSADKLQIGQVLYKARSDGAELNDRYKPGGRYCTGDMLDYYHVGVVTDIAPLEITHCTQSGSISGIKRDTTAKGWTHAGDLRGVEACTSPEKDEVETMASARVVSDNGKPVRMRKAPGTDAETITKVAVGTMADVLEQAEGWATIRLSDGQRGYMMTQYLAMQGDAVSSDTVTITIPRDAAAALLDALTGVMNQ